MARRSDKTDDNGQAPATQKVPAGVTPSMAQYLEIKTANPDSLLWYRMGDFYELFFTDAVVAAEALGIVLTKRGKHLGEDIQMCGVPVVRADEYLQRLIRQGFRVAVCEQLEDPTEARKRGSKAVVKRDVVRLVTPGTLTEDALLDAKTRNYLTSVFQEPGDNADYALASLDISTGEFEVGVISAADLTGELVRLLPGEVLSIDAVIKNAEVERTADLITAALTPVPAASFDSLSGERLMREYLHVSDLGAFGEFTRSELAAIGALLTYVELTQLGKRPTVRPPRRSGRGATMIIDAASRSSLEILRATNGDRAGSLLSAIDRTVTGPGARELASWVSSPMRDLPSITSRQDAVAFMVDSHQLRKDIQRTLRGAPDVARAISRLSLQRGGPRDLGTVRDAIATADTCASTLMSAGEPVGLPSALVDLTQSLQGPPDELAQLLAAALVDEPPALRREGGFVQPGYNAALDEALTLRDDSRKVMASLEAKYAETSGVKTLKVRHNNILGYFIEVTAANAKPLMEEPLSDLFRHRQTMANAVRFTTVELSEIEGRIASAAERALAIENDVFAELANAISEHEASLNAMASALAELDCVTGLGQLAVEQNYERPVVDDSLSFDIRGGRHPVVELALQKELAGPFIDNDCCLIPAVSPDSPPGFDDPAVGRIWLVTGPNMAGKSTFLRQNALITLLAQIGSYVPAKSAHIGVVDRLFSRVGASDDIASGRSTFMVEMVETAAILNQATERSFVILDEIGRGTATFDGLSIAWATVENLHDVNRCRALFATHYHELTALADRLGEIANVTVDVKEWKDEIVFLHKVKPGAADRSYGIHVARLAGLPSAVTARATEVLELLEKEQTSGQGSAALDELPLFAATREVESAKSSPLMDAITDINPDELTPRSALELVYRLKEIAREADE